MNINFKLSNQQVIYILIIILLLSLLFSCNNSSVVEGFEQDFKQGLFYLKTTGLDFQGNNQTSRGYTPEGYCLTAFRSSYSSNRDSRNIRYEVFIISTMSILLIFFLFIMIS